MTAVLYIPCTSLKLLMSSLATKDWNGKGLDLKTSAEFTTSSTVSLENLTIKMSVVCFP